MRFSVLMSVYAKENPIYLEQSLFSIWNQQLLKPDQIVLVKDGALTYDLELVIKKFNAINGGLITQVDLKLNVGLAAALNEGLKFCSSELVARMDADDIALPNRFSQQVSFIQANPDVVAFSGAVEEFDKNSNLSTIRFLPLHHNQLINFAKLRSPLSHPAVMFRKSAVLEVGGYPPFRNAQDYALWTLLIVKGYKLANLPDVLVKMRAGDILLDHRGISYLVGEVKMLRYQYKIGFLSRYEFLRNFLVRFFLRIPPHSVKRLLYMFFR